MKWSEIKSPTLIAAKGGSMSVLVYKRPADNLGDPRGPTTIIWLL